MTNGDRIRSSTDEQIARMGVIGKKHCTIPACERHHGNCTECAMEWLQESNHGLYQCFHCGEMAVSWDSDFDFSDYGMEGIGIVHACHCNACGADIEYYVRIGEENDQ